MKDLQETWLIRLLLGIVLLLSAVVCVIAVLLFVSRQPAAPESGQPAGDPKVPFAPPDQHNHAETHRALQNAGCDEAMVLEKSSLESYFQNIKRIQREKAAEAAANENNAADALEMADSDEAIEAREGAKPAASVASQTDVEATQPNMPLRASTLVACAATNPRADLDCSRIAQIYRSQEASAPTPYLISLTVRGKMVCRGIYGPQGDQLFLPQPIPPTPSEVAQP